MCGRYASSRRPDDLFEEFEIGPAEPAQALEPDYNVAPTKDVYAVLERPDRADRAAGPVRQLRVLRWGLVPSWAEGPAIGSRLINARVETVSEKPAFRRALSARRCLLPADGYYEWRATVSTPKQPFFVTRRDGVVLAMAGLYEFWRDSARPVDDPAAWLVTCTILTTAAEPALASLHDRMPVVLPRERYDAWLDPGRTDVEAVRALLEPVPPGRFEAYPVSTTVNDVRTNGAHLLNPVTITRPEDDPADATLF